MRSPKDQGDTVPSEEGHSSWTAVRARTFLYPVTRQSIDSMSPVALGHALVIVLYGPQRATLFLGPTGVGCLCCHCSPKHPGPPRHPCPSTCALLCVSLVWPGKGPCLQHSFCSPCLVRPVSYDSFSKVFFCQIQIFHSTARTLHQMPDRSTEEMKTEHCFYGAFRGYFQERCEFSCILVFICEMGLVLYA